MSVKHVARLSLAALLMAAVGWSEGRAQIVPVALDNSGFSYDVVWEASGTADADLSGDGSGASSYALVTNGYAAAHPTLFDPAASALPDDGTIVSPTGAVFQLQPYAEANALILNGAPNTLTLAPSAVASYSEISFLVSSLTPNRHSTAIGFTLNYTGGQTLTLTTSNPVSNLTSAPSADAVAAATLDSYVLFGGPLTDSGTVSLDEYDFAVSAPIVEKLQSVTIDPGFNQLDVYAISGIDPAPEPPTGALLLTSLGGWAFAARCMQVRSGFALL